MKKPDLDRLRELRNDLHALGRAGRLTQEAFERLWKQAVEAANGHEECLEGIETCAIWYGLSVRKSEGPSGD